MQEKTNTRGERLVINDLLFIVDLNEVERDNTVTVSLDFTDNYGPHVLAPVGDAAIVGATVHVIDNEESLYEAKILRVDSPIRILVKIDWTTEKPAEPR